MEELFRQHRDEVNRRLGNIENILERYLAIEERVNAQDKRITKIENRQRDWIDRIVQSILATGALSVIGASLKVIGIW